MMLFTHYAQIKDNYCISYYGHRIEYLIQLRLVRPFIEKELPGLRVFISCNDSYYYLLENEDRIITQSDIKDKKKDLVFIKHIFDNNKNPIQDFLEESDIPCSPMKIKPKASKLCLICPDSGSNTLSKHKVDEVREKVKYKGYKSIVVGSDIHSMYQNPDVRPCGKDKFDLVAEAGWIVGVENEYIYLGAEQGARTTLMGESPIFNNLFSSSLHTMYAI